MNAIMHPKTSKPMTYHELITDPHTKADWELFAANEFGRLAHGVGGRIKGTDTIQFIHHLEMPHDRTQKLEVDRTRLELGGI
jgi:hypothetical protein